MVDYKKLTDDLIKASSAAEKAAVGDDGGSANCDRLMLFLPRAREDRVITSIIEAGLHCRGKGRTFFGKACYYISPNCGGQGNSRYRAVQALEKSMEADGWKVSVHYQID